MSLFLSISIALSSPLLFSSFCVPKLLLSLLFHIKINYFLIVKFSSSELKGDDDDDEEENEAMGNWTSHVSTCFSFQICLCKISRHCSSPREEISDSTVLVFNSRPGSHCRLALLPCHVVPVRRIGHKFLASIPSMDEVDPNNMNGCQFR